MSRDERDNKQDHVRLDEELLQQIHDLVTQLMFQGADETLESRLEALICDNPTAQRLYADYMLDAFELHARLYPEGAENETQPLELSSIANHSPLSIGPSAAVASHASAASVSKRSDDRNIRRPMLPARLGRSWVQGALHPMGLVFLFGIVAAGMIAYAFWSRPQAPTPLLAGNAAPESLVASAVVARTRGAQWESGFAPRQNMLIPKQTLRLAAGLAELQFTSQATVLLEGPAELTIDDAKGCSLSAGKLTARVPIAAQGFRVRTPGASVIDLGTEFGVFVKGDVRSAQAIGGEQASLPPSSSGLQPKSSTEVHVFQGWVAVKFDKAKPDLRPIDVGVGQSVQVDPQSETAQPVVRSDPVKFVRSLDDPLPLRRGDILVSQRSNDRADLNVVVRRLPSGDQIGPSYRTATYGWSPLGVSPDRRSIYTIAGSLHQRKFQLLQIINSQPVTTRAVADGVPGPIHPGRRVGLAVEADGQVLLGTNIPHGKEQISRVDPRQENACSPLVSDLPSPAACLAVAPDGTVFVGVQDIASDVQANERLPIAVASGYVARVDPQTGAVKPLVRNIDPCGLVVVPSTGELLVALNHRLRETEIRRYRADGTDLGRVALFGDLNSGHAPIALNTAVQLVQLALESPDSLLAAFGNGGGLWRVQLSNGKPTLIYDEGNLQGVAVVGN